MFKTQAVISDFTSRNSRWKLDIELGFQGRGSRLEIFFKHIDGGVNRGDLKK